MRLEVLCVLLVVLCVMIDLFICLFVFIRRQFWPSSLLGSMTCREFATHWREGVGRTVELPGSLIEWFENGGSSSFKCAHSSPYYTS